MSKLVLVRHGLSEYNQKGIWTGWENPPLVAEGITQAEKTGNELTDIQFDYAFSSDQTRSLQTLEKILEVIRQDLPVTQSKEIRERDYGDLTKKNKWQVKEEVGEEEFQKIRRAWDYPPRNGESLKMVHDRAVPYYKSEILPKLMAGKNIIVASSGNTLRALAKYLENIPEEEVAHLEIGTGEAYVYEVDSQGKIVSKEIRGENPLKGKV